MTNRGSIDGEQAPLTNGENQHAQRVFDAGGLSLGI